MCSSSKGCVWWWIAALSVLVEILVFTAAQVNVPSALERNVALNKPCNQSSDYDTWRGNCTAAVNGVAGGYDSSPPDCIHTQFGWQKSWLRVDLGPNIYIHKIIIVGRSTYEIRNQNMHVLLDEKDFIIFRDNASVHNYTFNSTEVQKAGVVSVERHKIGADDESSVLNICEVEVYACLSDRYGLNCEKTCDSRCKRLNVTCDRLTGACLECQTNTVWGDICDKPCPEGCKRRDVICNRSTGACIECQNNTVWGEKCDKPCPEGCKPGNVICNRSTGACTECPDGKWGHNCTDACGAGCDETNCHLNGTCKSHCRSHWMPPKCDVCNPGKWGDDCLNDCGEGCKDGVCNKTNGHCNCTSTEMIAPLCGGCNLGKWGKNCENDCGVGCEGETCKKDDGSCECQPGWVGTKCDGRPCECGEECTTSRKYIFADIPRKVNVAIGKPSKASTIKKIDNDDSCLANDGYLSTSELTTCMSTAEGDPNPFWEVDLGGNYEIAGISIDFDDDKTNLKSGISILLDGKEIFVTNDQTTDPAYIPNNRRRNWTGQVLKLQRKGPRKDPLMICEVEVFNCLPGFFGYECEGICEKPVCDNARFCSRIDGSCQETVEVKETSDCSPLILVAGYVVGFLIISLFIFAAKVIPYKKKSKPTAVKKEAEGDKEEEKTEGEGSGSGGDKVESQSESGSGTDEKESQV